MTSELGANNAALRASLSELVGMLRAMYRKPPPTMEATLRRAEALLDAPPPEWISTAGGPEPRAEYDREMAEIGAGKP